MNDDVKNKVFSTIKSLLENASIQVDEKTSLIGDGRVLDSMKLVELCLLLEDVAESMSFEFDWTSETAMSKSRGMFRTAGALATEFQLQMEAQK